MAMSMASQAGWRQQNLLAVIAQVMGGLTVGKAAAVGMKRPCTPLLAA